jgi:hypothetical protein
MMLLTSLRILQNPPHSTNFVMKSQYRRRLVADFASIQIFLNLLRDVAQTNGMLFSTENLINPLKPWIVNALVAPFCFQRSYRFERRGSSGRMSSSDRRGW